MTNLELINQFDRSLRDLCNADFQMNQYAYDSDKWKSWYASFVQCLADYTDFIALEEIAEWEYVP